MRGESFAAVFYLLVQIFIDNLDSQVNNIKFLLVDAEESVRHVRKYSQCESFACLSDFNLPKVKLCEI